VWHFGFPTPRCQSRSQVERHSIWVWYLLSDLAICGYASLTSSSSFVKVLHLYFIGHLPGKPQFLLVYLSSLVVGLDISSTGVLPASCPSCQSTEGSSECQCQSLKIINWHHPFLIHYWTPVRKHINPFLPVYYASTLICNVFKSHCCKVAVLRDL